RRGNRCPPSTPIGLPRSGVPVGTIMSTASATFVALITVPAGPDTSAVYSANLASATGSLSGMSAEERVDAGPAPAGDMNATRGYIDRAVIPSTGGGIIAFTGEGFQPGETVNLSGCASASDVADDNGAIAFFIGFTGGSGP